MVYLQPKKVVNVLCCSGKDDEALASAERHGNERTTDLSDNPIGRSGCSWRRATEGSKVSAYPPHQGRDLCSRPHERVNRYDRDIPVYVLDILKDCGYIKIVHTNVCLYRCF